MKTDLKAVVLAGGLGTRLRPYTLFMPKPMLPLGDKPVLEHLMVWLHNNKIDDIVVCVGYLRRIIEEYFRNGKELGVRIAYARASRPMGTAGQLKSAEKLVHSTFFCVYGDSVYDFDINDMVKLHKKKNALATIALIKYKTRLKYGFIELDEEHAVAKWNEKPNFEGLINIGCYVMEPSFLNYIPKDTMFGMNFAFERAIRAKESIYGYVIKGDFIDIGDRRSYWEAYKKYLGKIGEIL